MALPLIKRPPLAGSPMDRESPPFTWLRKTGTSPYSSSWWKMARTAPSKKIFTNQQRKGRRPTSGSRRRGTISARRLTRIACLEFLYGIKLRGFSTALDLGRKLDARFYILDFKKICDQLFAFAGEHAFGMELHAFDGKFLMAQAHDRLRP